MSSILKWLTRILGFLSVVCFTGIIIIVTMQILSRYFPYSYIWTEELTRYLFLFGIATGAPIALLRNEYIAVDIIIARFPKRVRKVFDICIMISLLLISVIMIKESLSFVQIGTAQLSATMPIKMSWIHGSMLILSTFLSLFALVRIGYLFGNKKNPYEVEGGGEL
ncbi:TRAP transporter small permease [Bacillus sp. 1P02SD]|uniref:TRAP transporter small permease n=1 Tax=Bacillus sp. 1P02SD TaxID=3132264 RepID=UPI00399F0B62